MSRVERNRYTQDQIDQFVSAHERFQRVCAAEQK